MIKNFFLDTKLCLVLLLILIIPSFLPIIHHGFFPSQDYVYIARLFEMHRSLSDGNFPVRWVPDLRYGEPLFNFYAPLPYYIGGFLGAYLNFILVSKILLIVGFILAAFAMFYLSREFFGTVGGFISALLYTYAPYHSVDVYVRGALSEHWALIFFPLIFLFAFKLSQHINLKNLGLLSLSLAGLFYTHNVMTLMFVPFFILWIAFLFLQKKSTKFLGSSFLSVSLGIGLAGSFLLPAFFERQFIQTNYLNSGYFDFRAHFVELRQFFSTFWGYGASVWGGGDGMSFQVGVPHWIIFFITFLLSVIFLVKGKITKSWLVIFLAGCFAFSLFMMHNKSAFIWEKISLLAFIQFPWRFLAVSIFLLSFMGGYLSLFLNQNTSQQALGMNGSQKNLPAGILRSLLRSSSYFKHLSLKLGLTAGVCLLIIIFTLSYFKPEKYYDESFFDQFVNVNKLMEGFDLPKDYLPIWVKSLDREMVQAPHFVEGQGEVQNFIKKSGWVLFQTQSAKPGSVEVPISFFPGWTAQLNDRSVNILDPDNFGLIRLPVPAGANNIKLSFQDTPIRTTGNLVTVISLVLLIASLTVKTARFRR